MWSFFSLHWYLCHKDLLICVSVSVDISGILIGENISGSYSAMFVNTVSNCSHCACLENMAVCISAVRAGSIKMWLKPKSVYQPLSLPSGILVFKESRFGGQGCFLHQLTASDMSEEDEADTRRKKSAWLGPQGLSELLLYWHSLWRGEDGPELGARPISCRTQTASVPLKIEQVEQLQRDNVGVFRTFNTRAGSDQTQQ